MAIDIKLTLDLHLKWLRGEKDGKRANLARANLTDANLTDANLTDANLARANLMGANLTDANLARANLMGADLTGADLRGANLRVANLMGADLRGANLDFSSWPLWCGSLGPKVDDRLIRQLMYHVCRLAIDNPSYIGAIKEMLPHANQFNRVESGDLKAIELSNTQRGDGTDDV